MPPYLPGGVPRYWRDAVFPEMHESVNAFLSHQTNHGPEPTDDQLTLLVDYLRHWICAPAWNANARRDKQVGDELIRLRKAIGDNEISTSDEIHLWLIACLELGIDPL